MNASIKVKTLDLHAAGEPCRVIYNHFYNIPGDTMFAKREYLSQYFDDVRKALILEPRGHANMFGSVLTSPVSEEADAGVIFLTNSGFLDMCIHGSICTSRAVVEMGLNLKDPNKVVFDTVGGRITARLTRDEDGTVQAVAIENVPSFVYSDRPLCLQIEGLGEIEANVVFAGNFFAVVDGDRYENLHVCPASYEYLANVGMAIKKYVNEHFTIVHPGRPELTGISLAVIYNRCGEHPKHVKNVVVFGNKQIDRSPCGTGTSGMMVYLKSVGELEIGDRFISESIIGSCFQGYLSHARQIDGRMVYTPVVQGEPAVMAHSEFVLEQQDIYRYGIPVLL